MKIKIKFIIFYIDNFFKYLNNKLKIIHNNHMVYL